MGNIGSLVNMISRIGYNVILAKNPTQIIEPNFIIIPGVGAFDSAMKNLIDLGFVDYFKKWDFNSKTQLLGICLGMQLIFEGSEEGKLPGLGILKGNFLSFKNNISATRNLHMGWNNVVFKNENTFKFFDETPRFYFAHQFYLPETLEKYDLGVANFGFDFICYAKFKNVLTFQFHPEKSHQFGLNLLKQIFESI